MKKMIIQITSGQGPVECCRVAACVQRLMMKQAAQLGLRLRVLENTTWRTGRVNVSKQVPD